MWPEQDTLGSTAMRHGILVINTKSVQQPWSGKSLGSAISRPFSIDCATDSLELLLHCVLIFSLFHTVFLQLGLSLLLSCAFLPEQCIYKHSWEEAC